MEFHGRPASILMQHYDSAWNNYAPKGASLL
jgi:hypothetical protein